MATQLKHNGQAIMPKTDFDSVFDADGKTLTERMTAAKVTVDSAMSSSSTNPVQNKVVNSALASKVPTTRKVNNKALSADITLSAGDVGAIATSAKGTAGGVAELDSSGKVPASQLPSYVDDVIEGYLSGGKFYKESEHTTQITGESGKIFVDLATNKTYRWSGSAFIEISASLALGETSSSAYRGDKGKIAYDHSQAAHAPSNAERNVITAIKKNGTAITVDSSRAVNITVPTKVSELTNDKNYVTSGGTVATANALTDGNYIDGILFDGVDPVNRYATCSTAAGTAAKTITRNAGLFQLEAGARITVKFTVTNTAANPTLNVDNTGAKPIYYRGAAISAGYLAAGRTYDFVYNGTQYELVGDINTDTRYSTATASTAGIGKLYAGTGSATDGSMTQSAITSALNGKLGKSFNSNGYTTIDEITTALEEALTRISTLEANAVTV